MANVKNMIRKFQFTALVIGLALGVNGLSHAAVTDLSSAPLQTSTSNAVLPNLMFMLDDSGSMAWDYLPDPAQYFAGYYGFNSNQCNGTYYDPNTTYTPPVDSAGNSFPTFPFTAAPVDGYAYKAGTNTKVVNLNTGFTGGSGSGTSGYKTYSGPAFYYTYSGTQTTGAQKNYFNTSSTFYQECSSAIGAAPGNAVFAQTIMTTTSPTAKLAIPGNNAVITVAAPKTASNSAVSGITVGGVQIMSASTSSSSSTKSANTLAGFIVQYINNCTTAMTGNCTVTGGTGYSAVQGTGTNANVVTISGPGGAIVISSTGNLTETVTTPFPTLTATSITGLTVGGLPLISASTVSTTNNLALATSLAAQITSYGYCTATVGTGTSANTVTIVCPYAASALPGLVTTSPAQGGSGVVVVPNALFSQASSPTQLQNFSNWYTYYSNRMLMMKTSVGLAFSPINSTYRIGFMTMNNNVPPDFLDINTFVGNTLPANTCPAGSGLCQKDLWYTMLYGASAGNSTPLREALSHVGQLYAHRFGSITTYTATITVSGNGSTAVDDITVNGVDLFPENANSNPLATPIENSAAALAIDIANQINAPDVTAFGATVGTGASANVVTITGPASALGYAPQVTDSGPMTEVATSFTASTTTAQLNGVTPLDPIQYSCQQNFVILSTDGYWNGPNTYDLNNNPVGQQDGLEPRPMNDGGTAASMTQTQIVKYTSQVQQGTSVPQGLVTQLQISTMYLEQSTKSGSTWGAYKYTNGASCAPGSSTKCMYTISTANNSTAWTASAATWNNATTCTTNFNASVTTTTTSGNGTSCQYSSGSWVNTSSPPCVTATQPSGPSYTVATVVTQCGWSTPSITGVASCTPSASSTQQITCPGTAYTGPTPVASCTTTAASSGNQYIATTCQTNTTVTVTNSCTAATAGASNNYTTTTCTGGGGGTPNTLADVAEYYYVTDLRDNSLGNCTGALGAGIDVCQDDVPHAGLDAQSQQHMTTFTLGLGARGKMVHPTPPLTPYQDLTTSCNPATDGDFCAILTGPQATSSICSWQAAGTVCNWPVPVSGSNTNVDDLWHAAVNGRGLYFSATDPNTLGAGLTKALAGIQSRVGAASASATSSPNLTQSNNFLFSATYASAVWTGDVTSRTIDPTTGDVSATINWDAQSQLDSLINSDPSADKSTNRKVYMFDSANTYGTNLKPFLYGNMTATEQGYFNNQCNPGVAVLSQCTTSNLSAGQITSGNLGVNLVDYLRGSQALESPIAIYRPRTHFLGDTVNSKPLYLQFPIYSFTDPGYSAFVTQQTTTSPRQGVLYVGANDGMLHAFNVNTGIEMWAYVPKIVMPNLYKLADAQYATQHQYYVDGSPQTMDIYVASATNNLSVGWHTILVGGLGLGGQGFYALDVTNPSSPQALWEICYNSALCAISDPDLGYSYGNPIITKRSTDGRWVVLVTSGYNNGAGSGKGTLFELDAVTGAVLHKTTTDATATNPPSGLAKISSWIDSIATNYTSRYVYAGDLNGNVWRFDLGVPGPDVAPISTMIASLKDPSGVAQSVTTRPELADPLNDVTNSLTGTGNPGVFVATGRYLGASDVSNYQVQSVYAIKDDLTKTGAADYYPNPRTYATKPFVQQFLYQPTSTTRTVSANNVNWSTDSGWYVDFVIYDSSNNPVVPAVSPGERVNIDPQLVNGTLIVVTNIPFSSVCTAGGTSWQYSFNFLSGSNVAGSINAGSLLNNGSALTAGFTIVRLSDGELKALITDATGDVNTTSPPTHGTGSTQQTSWRELTPQ
ncbi:MAG: PilC/PilY family type IV pilus protein [Gallionella sp.]